MWPEVVAWVVQPKSWLVMAGGLALAGALAWGTVQHVEAGNARRSAAVAKQDAANQHVSAVQATAQSAASQDATTIVAAGAARDAQTLNIHVDNAHAIQVIPGASAPVTPELNRVGRLGLCRYAAERDEPGCVQLRQPSTGQPQGPGPGDGAPG